MRAISFGGRLAPREVAAKKNRRGGYAGFFPRSATPLRDPRVRFY